MSEINGKLMNELCHAADKIVPESHKFVILVFQEWPDGLEPVRHATNAHRDRAIEASYLWQNQLQQKNEVPA